MVAFETVRQLALALPEVEEGVTHGTPSFKVRKKFLSRLREEGVLVVKCDLVLKEVLLQSQPGRSPLSRETLDRLVQRGLVSEVAGER